eukprot:snap_masked-scaffold_34-processed-gene-2.6-mRNA-1 protein AED:0.01 eAED:0.01 QI:0/0/0/1/1/1/2/0/1110
MKETESRNDLQVANGRDIPVIIGICAMHKKTSSKAMKELIYRMEKKYKFKVIIFEESVILDKNIPVSSWPRCHAFISFFSSGFPLDRAIEYYKLYGPVLVNDLEPQNWLRDRRLMYKKLREANIPTPEHVVFNRSAKTVADPDGEDVFKVDSEDDLVEFDEYIIVKGVKIKKPFVEKPVDADDHNIYIYHPNSAGGGTVRLFRKVNNKSSDYFPDENEVRRDGSYIYEKFLTTDGTDVKVYAVTGNYAHAEARKSPVVDGHVQRDADGREVRYPVLLSSFEKQIAYQVTSVFGQTVCGFDLLKTKGKSFVCDVNGWSFVKKNKQYYDDAAAMLAHYVSTALGTHLAITNNPNFEDHQTLMMEEGNSPTPKEGSRHEELRCVIAVVRHGDRTPKQKLKLRLPMKLPNGEAHPYAEVFAKFKTKQETEIKLKTSKQMQYVLKISREHLLQLKISKAKCGEDGDAQFEEELEKMKQVVTVLERNGKFKGINRKVQLKKLADDSLLLILKWGGVLTELGRTQSESMGRSFRRVLYPEDGGLLRLHSTFRHNLKIYSSDEGRVQVTAAAFVRGLLNLNSHLTPLLGSLVYRGKHINGMLDDATVAKDSLELVKEKLHKAVLSSMSDHLTEEINPTKVSSISQALGTLEYLNAPLTEKLHELYQCIVGFVEELRKIIENFKRFDVLRLQDLEQDPEIAMLKQQLSEDALKLQPQNKSTGSSLLGSIAHTASKDSDGGSAAASMSTSNRTSLLSSTEMLQIGLSRWKKLKKDFYSESKKKFNLSKIPDIYDCAKYDVLHSPALLSLSATSSEEIRKPIAGNNLKSIFRLSRLFAMIIVPQEYGITKEEKYEIGRCISYKLLDKINSDMRKSVDRSRYLYLLKKHASVRDDNDNSSLFITRLKSKSKFNVKLNDLDETVHELDRNHATNLGIKSGHRHVRTRLYFTSESHIHSLLNTLRFADISHFKCLERLKESSEAVDELDELNYQTHLVFKLYEIFDGVKPLGAEKDSFDNLLQEDSEKDEIPQRFKLSVYVSKGCPSLVDENGYPCTNGEIKCETKKVPGEIRCDPCERMIPLWEGVAANDFLDMIDGVLKSSDLKVDHSDGNDDEDEDHELDD